MAVTRRAHAKINLTLDVGARRPDGYHEIRSVMQTIGLHDTVTVTQTPESPGVTLTVEGPEADGVPTGPTNIVHRAAVRLQKIAAARLTVPAGDSGLYIALHKRIPSQAGLGGGSSDAAATLDAVATLLGLHLSARRRTEIAATLGSDVPFFLTGGTALVEGLGERVTSLAPLVPTWPLVLVKPPIGVPTAGAYAALDALPGRPAGHATEAWLAGEHRPANDFEAVAWEVPEIAAARDALCRLNPEFPPRLCGSGAALFCRAADVTWAAEIAAALEAEGVGRAWATCTMGGGGEAE